MTMTCSDRAFRVPGDQVDLGGTDRSMPAHFLAGASSVAVKIWCWSHDLLAATAA